MLDAAAQALDTLGDRVNALHARLVGARRQLLVGELEAAEQTLAAVDAAAAHLGRAGMPAGHAEPHNKVFPSAAMEDYGWA